MTDETLRGVPRLQPAGGGRLASHGGRRIDATAVLLRAEAVAGAVLVAAVVGGAAVLVAGRLGARPAAPRAYVRMGPAGWVSLRGAGQRTWPGTRHRRR